MSTNSIKTLFNSIPNFIIISIYIVFLTKLAKFLKLLFIKYKIFKLRFSSDLHTSCNGHSIRLKHRQVIHTLFSQFFYRCTVNLISPI